MNTSELRAERIRQKKSVEYMARLIRKSNDTYAKKERGVVKFTPDEIAVITNDMLLSPTKLNAIFFDSKLPFSNTQIKPLSEL